MQSSAIATRATFTLLIGLVVGGCGEASDGTPPELGEAPGPLVISTVDDQLNIEAPAGAFNSFGIYASYNAAGCSFGEHVYGVTGPSGVRVENCPECLLPGTVRIGEPIPGFDLFACLPGVQGCEVTEDVGGLTFDDLNFETYVCGEIVSPDLFTIQYEHLDTTEPEAPRTFITVSAEFRIGADGAVEIVSEWEQCVTNDQGEICDGPSGSDIW